jgi:hypothetical protein
MRSLFAYGSGRETRGYPDPYRGSSSRHTPVPGTTTPSAGRSP